MIANPGDAVRRFAQAAARFAHAPRGLWTLAAIAAIATWSLSIPVGPFLIAFSAGAPRRWLRFALTANLVTALAAVGLALALEHELAPWLATQLPDLAQSPEWLRLCDWVDRWGLAAMLAWLALPLPQAPFLVFASLAGVASWKVFVAFLFGKGAKYALSAFAAAKAAEAARARID